MRVRQKKFITDPGNNPVILLYKISLSFYVAGIYLASFFNKKASLWINGRKNWRADLTDQTREWKNSVWFHCASLGEFEMIRPLVEKIRADHPSQKILITFFSPSGYEIRKNYKDADLVLYLPIDSQANAEYFIRQIKPVCAIFAKYEFWHYYISELKRNNIPFYAVSAVFREDHRFFKWYGGFFRNDLEKFTGIFVQDNLSASLLKKINIPSIVAGDTRFDRVISLSEKAAALPQIENFIGNRKVIIAGSSWEPEERALQEVVRRSDNDTCFIIAPHDISESHLQKAESFFPGCIRYSRLTSSGTDVNVLLIDNIGMLGSLYRYGSVAVIGGGFTGKLHNILEAAAFGNVVLFGPLHSRFREAQNLIISEGAIVFNDGNELSAIITDLFSRPEQLQFRRKKAKEFVYSNKGALSIIYPTIEKCLNP